MVHPHGILHDLQVSWTRHPRCSIISGMYLCSPVAAGSVAELFFSLFAPYVPRVISAHHEGKAMNAR
jgi:hypothetical protein